MTRKVGVIAWGVLTVLVTGCLNLSGMDNMDLSGMFGPDTAEPMFDGPVNPEGLAMPDEAFVCNAESDAGKYWLYRLSGTGHYIVKLRMLEAMWQENAAGPSAKILFRGVESEAVGGVVAWHFFLGYFVSTFQKNPDQEILPPRLLGDMAQAGEEIEFRLTWPGGDTVLVNSATGEEDIELLLPFEPVVLQVSCQSSRVEFISMAFSPTEEPRYPTGPE